MLFDDENYSKGKAEPPCSLYIILSQYMSPLATRLWVLHPERKDRKAVYLTMKPSRVSFEFCCEHPFSLELSWFFPTCAISCLGSNSSIYVDLIDGRTSASDQMTPHPHHRSGPAVGKLVTLYNSTTYFSLVFPFSFYTNNAIMKCAIWLFHSRITDSFSMSPLQLLYYQYLINIQSISDA